MIIIILIIALLALIPFAPVYAVLEFDEDFAACAHMPLYKAIRIKHDCHKYGHEIRICFPFTFML